MIKSEIFMSRVQSLIEGDPGTFYLTVMTGLDPTSRQNHKGETRKVRIQRSRKFFRITKNCDTE